MKTLVDFCNFPIIYHNVRLQKQHQKKGMSYTWRSTVLLRSILQRTAILNKGTIYGEVEAAIQFEYEKTHGMLFPLQKKKLWLHSWLCRLLACIVVRLGVMILHIKGKHYSTAL
jgi:hypothetical protein